MNTHSLIPMLFLCIVLCGVSIQCNLDRIPDAGPFECGQTFTDPRDGRSYKTIWIAEDGSHNLSKPGKCWMAENLDFDNETFGINCYAEEEVRCDTFGHMYNDFVLDNICMNGWHIATEDEWLELFRIYGWTEQSVSIGQLFHGNAEVFLPGGTAMTDFLLGGSCLNLDDCEGTGLYTTYWAENAFLFSSFSKLGSATVGTTAAIIGEPDLRYYIRCVQD